MARFPWLYSCFSPFTLVYLLILVLDIVAGILGIEAEITQNKAKHKKVWVFECRQPSHDAFRLGLAAASILALAHVIVNFLGAIVCIIKDHLPSAGASSNRQFVVICICFLWILAVVGISMLVIAALANSRSRDFCGFSHHHLLCIGGILCFIHGLFCIAFYFSFNSTLGDAGLSSAVAAAVIEPRAQI